MVEAEVISWVGQLGFPIAITIFLLFKGAAVIERNTEAIYQLKDAIVELKSRRND